MRKFTMIVAFAQLATMFATYKCTEMTFLLTDTYRGAITLSQAASLLLFLFLCFAVFNKKVRKWLGLTDSKIEKSYLVSTTVVAPLITMAVGNVIAYSFGGFGTPF